MPCYQKVKISFVELKLAPGFADHLAELTKALQQIDASFVAVARGGRVYIRLGETGRGITVNSDGGMWVTEEDATITSAIKAIKRTNSMVAIKAASKLSSKFKIKQTADNKWRLTMR